MANRKPICAKSSFLAVLASQLKARGVVFINKDGKKTQSQNDYWELYRLIKQVEVATAASAGTDVSLSGIGSLRFAEAGRTEESRCRRFKQKVSSSVQKTFKEHPELVSTELPADDAELMARVANVLAAMGAEVETQAEVIEANDNLI